jgi:hypothetical protein
MEQIRGPFQGVSNIIRFNWQFFLFAIVVSAATLAGGMYWERYLPYACFLALCVLVPVMVSLVVSYYIYDRSELYSLKWLNDIHVKTNGKLVTINAGFDETSALLRSKYPDAALTIFDFYDPKRHSEISIKRARRACSPQEFSTTISTSCLPVKDSSVDNIFVILSAHEIRDRRERTLFFQELCRAITPSGRIVVTEHIRDLPNFFAYTLGVFHFLPRSAWLHAFHEAGLVVCDEIKITPFITTITLRKHGNPS